MKRSAFASFVLSLLLLVAVAISSNTLLRTPPRPAAFTEGSFLLPQQVTAKGIMPESLTGGRTLQATANHTGSSNTGGAVSVWQNPLLLQNALHALNSHWWQCKPLLRIYLRMNVLRI